MQVAVLAGSPTDTGMGVAFAQKHNVDAYSVSVSASLEEQCAFEDDSPERRFQRVRTIIEEKIPRTVDAIMVYCNALCVSVDMDRMAEETGMLLVTPLDVYRVLAKQYSTIGVFAGSGAALAGIERVLRASNPDVVVWGVSMLEAVYATERGVPPEKIVNALALDRLCEVMATGLGAQIIILGCTNFPYFKAQLHVPAGCTVVDPSELMLRMLREKVEGHKA